MSHNRVEVVELALAAQRAGAVVVPLSYRASPDEVRRMIAFAEPAVVVAGAESRAAVTAAWSGAVVDLSGPSSCDPAEPTTDRPGRNGPSRLGAGPSLLFTSGTTAQPKAALRTKGDPALSAAIGAAFGFGETTRFLIGGPLYHSGPWTCALMALSRGGAVAVRPSFDALDWLSFAAEKGMNSSFLTPSQLRRLVDEVECGGPIPHLTNVVVSGEPFPPSLKRRAVDVFGLAFGECYGCTELGPLTWMPAEELLERPASCGKPFPGVEVRAFGDLEGEGGVRGTEEIGVLLPRGEVGVLRARTPMAFDGYVCEPGGSPDGSGQGWATVRDAGYVDDDGYVNIVGRTDDMIISGGVNVFPADVEAVLLMHPSVRECAVFGVEDAAWGQIVCAAIVSDAPLSVDEVRTWLRGRIADDKRPRRIVSVASLPRTATDKLSRHALQESALRL